MSINYVPGPNNEMIPKTGPDTSSRFPINGDFATSASWASFAATASYLIGSVKNAISASWAVLSGHALTAETASVAVSASYATLASSSSYSFTSSISTTSSYAFSASYAESAATASYVIPGPIVVSGSGDVVGYINVIKVTNITAATIVDSFPSNLGNSAKWLLSIGDGTNFRASELISIWNPADNSTNFAEFTTNAIGTVNVVMSVNLSAGNVRLISNPASGDWTIKAMRFIL